MDDRKFNKKMGERLYKMCQINGLDFGDFIENSGVDIYYIDRYFNGKRDSIDERHLLGFARAFNLAADDLYEMLCGNKPGKSRFSNFPQDLD